MPIDETRMFHIVYRNFVPKPGEVQPKQDFVPRKERPTFSDDGRPRND